MLKHLKKVWVLFAYAAIPVAIAVVHWKGSFWNYFCLMLATFYIFIAVITYVPEK